MVWGLRKKNKKVVQLGHKIGEEREGEINTHNIIIKYYILYHTNINYTYKISWIYVFLFFLFYDSSKFLLIFFYKFWLIYIYLYKKNWHIHKNQYFHMRWKGTLKRSSLLIGPCAVAAIVAVHHPLIEVPNAEESKVHNTKVLPRILLSTLSPCKLF